MLGNKLSETYAGIGEDGKADVANTKTYTYDCAGRMLTSADFGDNITSFVSKAGTVMRLKLAQ